MKRIHSCSNVSGNGLSITTPAQTALQADVGNLLINGNNVVHVTCTTLLCSMVLKMCKKEDWYIRNGFFMSVHMGY